MRDSILRHQALSGFSRSRLRIRMAVRILRRCTIRLVSAARSTPFRIADTTNRRLRQPEYTAKRCRSSRLLGKLDDDSVDAFVEACKLPEHG